jgi:excinuclease UvrABC nuclease subunit
VKIDKLSPPVEGNESFRKSCERFLPDQPGCYVLATFGRDVLYIGLAISLRRRIAQHLENPGKTALTSQGRAVMVHWRTAGPLELEKLERTWLLIHEQYEAKLPPLNSVHSPVSV